MDNHTPPAFHPSFYGPRYWPTWIGLGFFHLLGYLPMSISLAFGRLLGDVFYYLAGSRRHIARVNIALCFPELSADEQKILLRKVMHSTGKSVVESSVALWGPERQLKNRYSIRGLEHIQAAQAKGQGVLLVGCHFTTLDAAARILSFHVKYDMLYRKDPNPLLAYKLISARESFAGTAIVRTDTRQLIKNLRRGHVVWYAPDQDSGSKNGVFVPFFGVPAATVVATARVAELGRAVVLPFAHYRDENNHYHLVIEPPLENFPTGDDIADATRINHTIETAVAKQPDQYLWVHRRFKTRPEGEPSFYAKRES
ncbi:LpxL/LpxP family Kdo(2)-lipid IV(A) lauroyl/palmitoleoyl acyltransferase [Cellvibrio sp.]|uniref:LpxL/LpxP family Kdo(2)-lipid IV(A) lauroyl/palmitoleoyl acyltransferase n=1 Tax=Cellvibrio sp. TaxID=1965322 RepID=UPI003964836A